MTDFLMPRRKFLTGLFGLVAAPAVVKAANIMPVKVIESKWYLAESPSLQSMANPIIKGSGINLSELRELLLPGAQQMVDDMYTEHHGKWKSIFLSRG